MYKRQAHGAAGRAAFGNNDFRRGPVNVAVITPRFMARHIQQLEFPPSSFWCIHVSEHTSTKTKFGTLVGPKKHLFVSLSESLESRFKAEHINAIFLDRFPLTINQGQTAVDWLANAAGISHSRATAEIKEFPIPVAKFMNSNARNPIQFLALAAAISKKPDVILYESVGMDPSGIAAIHQYAPSRYDGCLIHLATRPIGDNLCPDRAECLVALP